jgi:hypothetical protein
MAVLLFDMIVDMGKRQRDRKDIKGLKQRTTAYIGTNELMHFKMKDGNTYGNTYCVVSLETRPTVLPQYSLQKFQSLKYHQSEIKLENTKSSTDIPVTPSMPTQYCKRKIK